MTGREPTGEILETDVLIVGGGFAGGTLACALARGGVSSVVIDREDPKAALRATYDGRAFAIALAAQRLLVGADLWDLMADEVNPIGDIRVTDGDSLMFLHYDHESIGDEPFGFMIETQTLRRALAKKLPTLDLVTWAAPTEAGPIDRTNRGVETTLPDGRRVRAKLLVGADGRGSRVREEAGIDLTSWSYHQTGIVCTVTHEYPHDNIAHEHFLPSGPFAILPLKGNRSSIVWTEKEALTPAIMDLDDEGFLTELRRRFGDFMGDIAVSGPRFAYPLSLQYAHRATDKRLALVADAAHGMHPIAGQGLNMGLRDVAALAEVVVDAHRLGQDIGAPVVLEAYERWRRFDNTLMLALTDGLNRLFSNNIPPLRVARDLGLAVVNKMPPVKKFFMRHAMGLVGDLPRMLKGEPL
ncbi:UbiH/UbiF/VisC/COQ6 family ubiquinone biosynthesis hydroxylase [Magnetospira sp. QH-2]|uniref:UbiH/UbiF/VisC/COQ6 family ubiquinone biosynthesis hydroxylase n=1 Tax=Magnetospira sp. (strain QH-2) TaxID=1288970 RepID=UPI0003E810E2|nr:UbiH/UbiF/VisC/COQ6 family ubiquinone biosynthesis hydroxylase [Magnetospira sp. QH-2]CCQ75423.1 putative 2-polyprenyl-6-methoxyphenol 4-hydroxylase[Include FAD dependent oxidoreductase domain] [Magnetospira sp. QH-2]